MELAPENLSPICLSQTEIDAQFEEQGMLAHLQNTCNPHTVKGTKVKSSPITTQLEKPSNWEFVEFRSKSDKTKQCKYKWRPALIDGEEEYHVLWYRALDGKIYVVDNLDPALLGL